MKIGIFFSQANGQLDSKIDLKSLSDTFAGSYLTKIVDSFFDAKSIKSILKETTDQDFDGIILAGESPLNFKAQRSGGFLIKQLEATGVNPNRIVIANLKEQVADVHPNQLEIATQKAKLLVEVALAKVNLAQPVESIEYTPRQAVLIIGNTPGAFLAAERLLEHELKVYIVSDQASHLSVDSSQEAFHKDLAPIISFVEMHNKALLIESAELTDFFGFPGHFTAEITTPLQKQSLKIGAIIVCNPDDVETAEKLRPLLHIEINDEGYFKPLNDRTLPFSTNEEGIFLLGHQKFASFSEITVNADATALAAINFVKQQDVKHSILVSKVNEKECGGCGACVKTCLFHASKVDPVEKFAVIEQERCKGCGNCVTACPTGARDLLSYPEKYMMEAIKILSGFEVSKEPKVLAFLCEGCGYKALDLAGESGLEYPAGVLPLSIRCGGNIDTQYFLQAYKHGFDGVLVCKCSEGHCLNIVGNLDLERRANLFREILRSRGIEDNRLRIVDSLDQGKNVCVEAMNELYSSLTKSKGGHSND